MTWAAVEMLPQSSVAVQVRVTEYVPAHAPGVVTSAEVRVKALPHTSLAAATANDGVAGQLIVTGAGNDEITGGVSSITLIVCVAVATFPHASVAVQSLVTLYSPAQSPEVDIKADSKVKALPHPSVAIAVANTGDAGQLIVDVAGNPEITGASVSITLIVCAAVAMLPQASVAVHVRVTLYAPAQRPGVVTSADTSVNALPHRSDAVATANTGVAGQLIVDSAGNAEITGAVLSSTLIVWARVDILPHASVAVHVLVTEYSPAHGPGKV